jgi:pimeloyl-ACP methyl ester carboxylesterase
MSRDVSEAGRLVGLMHERWFDADGRWVHTVHWEPAEPSAGAAPVVLVHGLGASTLSWELVAGDLANRLGTRVTALDLPGFGRSRANSPATMSSHGAAVTALLRDQGPAIVMGNSMGGATSVGVAARHPELVHALVLVNAAFPRPGANLDQLARTARYAALTLPAVAAPIVRARAQRLGPERLVDTTLGLVFAERERIDPALRERLVALAVERRAYPEAARSYTESGGSLFRYLTSGMRADLDAIHAPTLVMHGRRDRLVPVSFARAVAERRDDWRYVELADCGHVPQLEFPARFVDIVSRWSDRELRDPAARA